jgi:predicted nucleotidyltransferase component of viral defense system
MLSYEALVEQAKIIGLPSTKMRGILREYLQILILKEIYRNRGGKKLYFTGGTYLRLIHSLKRFSEDLDFNSSNISKKKFEKTGDNLRIKLAKVGIKTRIKFAHRDIIFTAKILFPEIENYYNIVSKYSKKEGIMIKLEVNTNKEDVKSETEVVSGFGETFPCLCTNRAMQFADKIEALLKKRRGRHLYDIIFMLSNKFPIDKETLKNLGIMQEPLDVILNRVRSLSLDELTKQANILRPFLFDESEANLVKSAHKIVPKLIEKYRAQLR